MKRVLVVPVLFVLLFISGCKKKETPEPIAYASFSVNGVVKKFEHTSRFTKDFCSSSTYCGNFRQDTAAASATLHIGIPGDPLVGYVYATGEYRFKCYYMDEAGKRYDFTGKPFSVVFTVWEGQGGWARGNFQGWMRSAEGDSVEFTGGYFQNRIWTMGTMME